MIETQGNWNIENDLVVFMIDCKKYKNISAHFMYNLLLGVFESFLKYFCEKREINELWVKPLTKYVENLSLELAEFNFSSTK